MSDNAQPTVITAAEFVSGGYAQRVAAGECVVRGWAKLEVRDVTLRGLDVAFEGTDFSWTMRNTDTLKLHVEWLPATDELASLRAQVARYRSALEAIVKTADGFRFTGVIMEYETGYIDAAEVARAALAETEEANG